MPVTPVPISPLPLAPDRSDRGTFSSRATAMFDALKNDFVEKANALAVATHDNAAEAAASVVTCAEQVALATQQAALATSNGAEQVALATQQAALATSNGAEQVALATQQAALATSNGAEQVALATQQAALAAGAANYKGLWSSLAGALAMPASVGYGGSVWLLNAPLADVTAAEPGSSAAWSRVKVGAEVIPYDSRADLRSATAQAGDQAIITGLGLFVFEAGSDEPDDDESCFATAAGRWLLQAASWDLIDAWQAPDADARDVFDEDEPLRFASKVLTGSATCSITSVAANAIASFTGTVPNAAVGDRVIATPPDQLGSNATDTARLSYHAWVSAADTVTVMLTNASASTATTNTAVRTAWPITVIKP